MYMLEFQCCYLKVDLRTGKSCVCIYYTDGSILDHIRDNYTV